MWARIRRVRWRGAELDPLRHKPGSDKKVRVTESVFPGQGSESKKFNSQMVCGGFDAGVGGGAFARAGTSQCAALRSRSEPLGAPRVASARAVGVTPPCTIAAAIPVRGARQSFLPAAQARASFRTMAKPASRSAVRSATARSRTRSSVPAPSRPAPAATGAGPAALQ